MERAGSVEQDRVAPDDGRNMTRFAIQTVATVLACLAARPALAEESTAELAKAAQNPLANMISIPFQNDTSFGIGPFDRTQNVLNIQPVIPYMGGRVITRMIVPLVSQPYAGEDSGGTFGFGDVQLTALYAPPSNGVIWGVGPVLSFPTGGSERGTRKWAGGASVVALATPGPWVVGGLVNNVWSFAGSSDAADVSFLTFQPFINYNVGAAFYLTFQPIITANWEAASGQQWTVPLGLGVGKLVRIGAKGLPINLNLSAFDNVVKPDGTAGWQLRVAASVLLPTSIIP